MMTTRDMIARLRALDGDGRSAVPGLFAAGAPIHVARAPGRLNVMGGISDYSGSLVLEMPIAEAAFVGMQSAPSEDGVLIVSMPQQPDESPRRVSISGGDWRAMRNADYDIARRRLSEDPAVAWAAYVVGPLLVMLRETNAAPHWAANSARFARARGKRCQFIGRD